jgi:hypothetical protein
MFKVDIKSRSKQTEKSDANIAQFINNIVPLISREFKERSVLISKSFISQYPAIAKSITTEGYGEGGFRLYADNPEVFPPKSFTYTNRQGKTVNKKNYWKSSPIKALMQEFGYYPTNEYAKKRWGEHKPNETTTSSIARNKGYLRIALITAADSLDSSQKIGVNESSLNFMPENYVSAISEIIPRKIQNLLTKYVTGRQLPNYLRGMAAEASQRMSSSISKFGQVSLLKEIPINVGVRALTEFSMEKRNISSGTFYAYENAHLRESLTPTDGRYPADIWSD